MIDPHTMYQVLFCTLVVQYRRKFQLAQLPQQTKCEDTTEGNVQLSGHLYIVFQMQTIGYNGTIFLRRFQLYLPYVFLLLFFQSKFDEDLLKLFITIINNKLLEAVFLCGKKKYTYNHFTSSPYKFNNSLRMK